MSDNDGIARGLELLLPDPEVIARPGENLRPEPDEHEDDGYEPPRAA